MVSRSGHCLINCSTSRADSIKMMSGHIVTVSICVRAKGKHVFSRNMYRDIIKGGLHDATRPTGFIALVICSKPSVDGEAEMSKAIVSDAQRTLFPAILAQGYCPAAHNRT